MAREDNLIPGGHKLTLDEQKAGGKASGEARRQKATMLQTLEMLLEETNNKSGKTYRELATLGLIKGAINGNANNYRTMLEVLGELKQIEDDRKEREITKVEELLNKITDEASK